MTTARLPDVGEPTVEKATPSAAVVDLRQDFGARYRIRREAGGATWYETPKEERLSLLEVLCRYGIVYPHGGELLAAWTGRPRIGSKLRVLPCVLSARGDAETVVTFHVDNAASVLRILKPYRRRRLSEAQRLRNAQILANARQQRRRESLSESHFPTAESTQAAGDRRGAAASPVHVSEGTEVAPTQAARRE